MKLSIITVACALSLLPTAGVLADEMTTTSTTIQEDSVPLSLAPTTTIIDRTLAPAPVVVTPAPPVCHALNGRDKAPRASAPNATIIRLWRFRLMSCETNLVVPKLTPLRFNIVFDHLDCFSYHFLT